MEEERFVSEVRAMERTLYRVARGYLRTWDECADAVQEALCKAWDKRKRVDESYFRNTAEAKWLAAHCAEYGFVIRYPEDKESVTGIIYEPWHLRFVGVKHAKRMNELNMCLEEYCEYIKSGNS